ncbi:MAG: hypothetical protein H8F28_13105 [Fibrella sp.]|nr:hypothetical protein [Armatimonadota bacterium]
MSTRLAGGEEPFDNFRAVHHDAIFIAGVQSETGQRRRIVIRSLAILARDREPFGTDGCRPPVAESRAFFTPRYFEGSGNAVGQPRKDDGFAPVAENGPVGTGL